MKNLSTPPKFKLNKTVITRFIRANTNNNFMGTSIVTSSMGLLAA